VVACTVPTHLRKRPADIFSALDDRSIFNGTIIAYSDVPPKRDVSHQPWARIKGSTEKVIPRKWGWAGYSTYTSIVFKEPKGNPNFYPSSLKKILILYVEYIRVEYIAYSKRWPTHR